MSKSTIPMLIEHNGEYCGECQFLRYGIVHGYWCQIYTKADLRRYGGDVKRCYKCIRQAVPVEKESGAD